MTEEELKQIQADQKAPLTESQKKRNAFWIQMLGAAILLITGFVLVIALEIAAAWFLGRIVKADVSVMKTVSPLAVLAGIIIAWFISRQACKFLVLKTKWRVDRLIGQQEIVIKTLGNLFQGLKMFSGATVLGDGRIALILDVATILQ